MPEGAQDVAKRIQRGPQGSPRSSQGARRASQGSPEASKIAPKWCLEPPKRHPKNERSKTHGTRARTLRSDENCNIPTRKRRSRKSHFFDIFAERRSRSSLALIRGNPKKPVLAWEREARSNASPDASPVQPNASPVHPSTSPVQPSTSPVQPNTSPVQPNTSPVQPNDS